VPHRVTYRKARSPDVGPVPVVELGPFIPRCRLCGAKFFALENCNRQDMYNQCCHLGKISLPELGACPATLRHYLTSPDHEGVQFRVRLGPLPPLLQWLLLKRKAPPIGTLGGVPGVLALRVRCTYHYTHPVPVDRSETLRYNQLYFVDADEACGIRESNVGDRVDARTMRNLEAVFRRINPLARSFRHIASVARSMSPDTRLNRVYVLFKDNIRADYKRYNLPTCRSEIAAVYVGDQPPLRVDLVIYPKG
jgi:hypothetical protein